MKKILQLLLNLFLFCTTSYLDILLVIWYGKLPKMSVYHRIQYFYDVERSFQDEAYQSERYVKSHLENFFNSLKDNPDLNKLHLETNLPIYDECHNIIGEQTLFSVMNDEYLKYLKTLQ